MNLEYAKKDYEISVYKYELSTDYDNVPADVKQVSYFKQEKLAMIGTNKYKSPIDACSPKVTININGKKTLSFNLYYQYLDYKTGEYLVNPLINIVQNDSLIELKLDNKYYDLIITKVQKNSEGTVYNYTAEDASIIELGKSGFNAELNTELENNMGTVQELGTAILKGSDWKVAPQVPDPKTGLYSDLIIQSLEDALYSAQITLSVGQYQKRSNYLPDAYYIHEVIDFTQQGINNGTIYIFYNDWVEKTKPTDEIGFLYCGAEPELNADGTIVNSYNYVTTRATLEAAAQNLALSDYRGRRVVKSPKTGYDYDLRQAITYYEKNINGVWTPGYYGYAETNYLSPILTQNYLSNPHNMTSLYDWVQLYGAEEGIGQPKTVPHLLLEVMPYPTYSPYVSYIRANGEFLNKGLHGYRTQIKELRPSDTFILAILNHTEGYVDPTDSTKEYNVTTDTDEISFKAGFYSYNNGDRNSITMYSDMEGKNEGVVFGSDNGYAQFSPEGQFIVTDPIDNNKKKYFDYMEFKPTVTIEDITENYGLDYKLGSVFKSEEDVQIFDVMFFRKEVDKEGNLIYPGRVSPLVPEGNKDGIAEELLQTYYYIYEDTLRPLESSSGFSRPVDRVPAEGMEGKYRVVYNDNFEKVSSINGKESNYYTLLSNLTKTFECWAQYVVARDHDGHILYDDHYYNMKTGEEIFYSPESIEDEEYFYDSNGLKLAGKERYYKWELITNPNGPLKVLDWYEDFDQFLTHNDEATSAQDEWVLSNKEYKYREVKDFDTEYIYQISLVGYGTYPHPEPIYCQLKLYYRDFDNSDLEISVIKKPSKWVCFKNYLNDTPNWSGFKYGINIKSIQRVEDNTNFSTKVIVKNNNNEFAINKFCSIARAQDNPTRDNFIIDFGYYVRQGLLDKTELTKDLYDEETGYFPRIKRLNQQNEEATDLYVRATTAYDRARAEWETYYLGAQAAQENIERHIKMLKNCGDEFYVDLENGWNIGGLWPIRDKVYVVKTTTDPEDMGSATSYEFFVGLEIDKEERVITTDDNYTYDDESDDTRVKTSLDGIELPVIYFYNGKSTDEVKKGNLYTVDPDTLTPKIYNPRSSADIYYYFPDYIAPEDHSQDPDYDYEDYEEETDLATLFKLDGELKRYHTYNGDGEDYPNKSNYLFNKGAYRYCQKIDELLLKKDIFNKLEQPAKMALETAKSNIDNYKINSFSLVEQKNAILREFLSKYSYFLRESTWTKDDYTDDNLYYLDARDSLHAAAFPKISYNISVVNMADYENYNCYKLKVGDYTFVEDTEFFGWDDKGRPAKEWVVVTEASYDLEQPENDQIKIQNYKSQLEDLFTRISASIQNLELTIGGYNRRISNYDNSTININTVSIFDSEHPTRFNLTKDDFQLAGCVVEDDCIHSQNFSIEDGTGWAFYSTGEVIIRGQEI